MKILKFKIENYRAIEKVVLNLNSSMTPIIGINESGKTTVLNAILAFDKTRDGYKNGSHLEFDNNYRTTETENCKITATFTLSAKELKELLSASKAQISSDSHKVISSFSSETEFSLSRCLSSKDKEYVFEWEGVSDICKERIAKYLQSAFPFILYFDDFTDRVPDEIDFLDSYKERPVIRKSKGGEWRQIVEEIFRKAMRNFPKDINEPLAHYLKMNKSNRKEDILSDIEGELNKEIIAEWKIIRRSGSSLADDSDHLSLSISNEGNKFSFKVRDRSRDKRTRTFYVSERSKGFQWFFNYMVKLKYNPNYKGSISNTLFLLDEPGSYLHSAAQEELIKELKRVSKSNIIVYCTHSQYLLNPSIINLGSLRIASKKSGEIYLDEYGEYKGSKSSGALSPIYQALHLNFSPEYSGKVVITEGVSDYLLFTMLKKHTNIPLEGIRFIPGAGASQLSGLLSFAISFSEQYLCLLDNDKEGKKFREKYINEFGPSVKPNIQLYRPDEENFVLEDFFNDADKAVLIEITGCKDVKRAIGILYYDYPNDQGRFIRSLSGETLNQLEAIFSKFLE